MRVHILAPLSAAVALAAPAAYAADFTYSTDFAGGVGAEWSIAAPTNSGASGILGELGGGGSSATLTRTASNSGTGVLEFDLLLFRTMDGVNAFTDQFNLVINGSTRYQAAFGTIAGGGVDTIFLNPDGATFVRTDIDSFRSVRHVTISFVAVSGANTFGFSYPGLQSFADEAWGLDNVSFVARGAPTGGIPEPSTWALMIAGFGAAGIALRRRRSRAVA